MLNVGQEDPFNAFAYVDSCGVCLLWERRLWRWWCRCEDGRCSDNSLRRRELFEVERRGEYERDRDTERESERERERLRDLLCERERDRLSDGERDAKYIQKEMMRFCVSNLIEMLT